MEAKHLVIFDLPAVVRYDHLPLRKALIKAIENNMPTTPSLQDINWSDNVRGVVFQIFNTSFGRIPTLAEIEAIRHDFNIHLKTYFLSEDDPFDVWSEIQNIFKALDRRKDWDFLIISDYWRKPTEFILNSCGIHSPQIKLLTAEAGLSSSELIKSFAGDNFLSGDAVIYLMARSIGEIKDLSFVRMLKRLSPPLKLKANMLEYPRFNKLFTQANLA